MENGIYHVKFSSPLAKWGEGLVVIDNNRLNGGDPGFLYKGTINESAGQLTIKMSSTHWNPAVQNIFGDSKAYSFTFSGTFSEATKSFSLKGKADLGPSNEISIVGRKLSDIC